MLIIWPTFQSGIASRNGSLFQQKIQHYYKTTVQATVIFQDRIIRPPQFSCKYSQGFTLHLNDTSALQSAVVITSIACPVTILLNALVLIVVRQKQELQRTSNILLCSLARQIKVDLLIGTVSMPLTILFGVIVLQKVCVDNFCTMFLISALVLELTCTYSLFLLTLIAWERYMAITKWIERKAVTKGRVEKYAIIVLLITIFTVLVQFFLLETPGIDHKVPDILPIMIFCLPSSICLTLIVYFYIRTFREVFGRKLEQISLA